MNVDVDCGRGVGARAIAVATGGFSMEELESHGPVATLPDLSDTARVLELIAQPKWRARTTTAALANVARWNVLAAHDAAIARNLFSC